ncbi:hypothetical protein SCARD494_00382 [Seiridium cardinale]
MTTIQNARPEVRTRADSLSRMLELEKQYRMQRLQDIGSTLTPTPPRSATTSSASSAQPNSVLKARRASAHPVVSPPQTPHMMIMKATTRSSGPPSLSISVPPPLTSAVAVRTDEADTILQRPATPTEFLKQTGERTKTVTFSDPEEEEGEEARLSDQSSICQSPSWAVYRQNKKKDKKREAAQKKKENERLEKANKKLEKKRLSKVPRQGIPDIPLLATSNRSLSAPELEQHQMLNERSLNRSTSHYPPDSMANHHNLLKQPAADDNSKPKSKGLFSGFRFAHSNTTAAQKTELHSRTSMDDSSSLRSGPALGTIQLPGNRGDMAFLNPRKPPSIKSTQSSSAQSHSSQERQTGASRKSFTHGRSHSLLAKLKGPSYLYAKSLEPNEESEPPESVEQAELTNGPSIPSHDLSKPTPVSGVSRILDRQEVRSNRGRQPQAHIPQPRDSSSEYEDAAATNYQYRRIRQPIPDSPVANEGRRRPSKYGDQGRIQYQDTYTAPIPPPRQTSYTAAPNERMPETRRHFPRLSQPLQPVHAQVAVLDQPTPIISPHSDKSYATVYTDAVDKLSERHSPHTDCDQSPVCTHRSTIRPNPAKEDDSPTESCIEVHDHTPLPGVRHTERQMTGSIDAEGFREAGEPRDAPVASTRDQSQSVQEVHIPGRSADYLTFISESYAPPSLELRSPIEDGQQPPHDVERINNEEAYEDEDPAWAALLLQSPELEEENSAEAVDSEPQNGLPEGYGTRDSCDSPTLSAHDPDSYGPILDHLMITSPAVEHRRKTHSFELPLEDQPVHSVSERSSSSTCNDLLHSPSTATTPDISRPQSRNGTLADVPRPSTTSPELGDWRPSKKFHRSKLMDFSSMESTGQTGQNTTLLQDASSDGKASLTFVAGHPHNAKDNPASNSIVKSPTIMASRSSVIYEGPLVEEEEEKDMTLPAKRLPLPLKTQSAIELATGSSLTSRRYKPSHLRNNGAVVSSISLPNSPPPELDLEAPAPRRSALKAARSNSSSSQNSSNTHATSAAYLQEARKTAPSLTATSHAARPMYSPRNSAPAFRNGMPSDIKGDSMAKMLVQCCNCHFFHDMPSRVYECMAKPDSIVEDKQLGVSAAITTTVKCPWCAHGMTMQCCSGYAALIFLKEKLHGK